MAYTSWQAPKSFTKPQQPVGVNTPQAYSYTPNFNNYGPKPTYAVRQRIAANGTFDYNNPFQINSVADVISEALNPNKIGNVIPDAVNLIQRGTIDPLLKGDFNAFKDNVLMNMSETMGILGNPVKALAMGKGFEGLKNSFGLGNDGRVNYDWNTGNVFGDMALEFISDPFTWITLGTGAVASKAAKGATDAALDATKTVITDEVHQAVSVGAKNVGIATAKDLASDLTTKTITSTEYSALKRLTHKAVASYLRGDTATLQDAMLGMVDSLNKPNTLHLLTKFSGADLNKLVRLGGDIAQQFQTDVILKSLRGLTSASETVQRGLFRAVLDTSGILPAWKLATGAVSIIDRMHGASLHQQTFKAYTVPGTDNIDTFRLPDIKQDFDDQMVKFNTAAQFVNETGVDPAIFSEQMRKEVTKQLQLINNLVEKFPDNPVEFNTKLGELLGHPSEDVLQEYYQNLLHNNNTLLHGALDQQVQELQNILARTYDLEYNAKVKATISALHPIQGQLDANLDYVKNVLFNPTQADSYYNNLNELKRVSSIPSSSSKQPVLNAASYDLAYKVYMNSLAPKLGIPATEALLKRIEAIPDIWHKLGIDLPGHNTFSTMFETYKIAFTAVLDSVANPTALNKAIKEFADVSQALKTIIAHYEKRFKATSVVDPYGKTVAMPQIKAVQLHTVELIRKTGAIKNATQINPIDAGDFQKLKTAIHDVFVQSADLAVHPGTGFITPAQLQPMHTLLKKVYPKFMDIAAFSRTITDFLQISEEVVEHPERFLGSMDPQQLYRRHWRRMTRLVSMLVDPVILNRMHDLKANKNMPAFEITKINQYIKLMPKIYAGLNKLNPVKIERMSLQMSAVTRLQQLKLEESYIAEAILGSKELSNTRAFLDSIVLNNTPIANTVNAFYTARDELTDTESTEVWSNTIIDAACTLRSNAHSMRNYRLFVQHVAESNILPNQVKAVLKSVLQNYRNYYIKSFTNYFDWFVSNPDNPENILAKITSFINTTRASGSLSLDALAKKYGVEQGTAHTAVSDVHTTKEVMLKAIPDEFNTPGVDYVFVDIETTGLDAATSSTLEIACETMSNKKFSTTRAYADLQATDIPTPALLNKFFPGQSELTQRQLFKKRYAKSGVSEFAMYQAFNQWLKELGPNVQLVYHNGDRFDVPFQKCRATLDQQYFTTLSRVDTLRLLQKKEKYFEMDQATKVEIRDILKEYVTLQEQSNPDARFIELPNGSTIAALKVFKRAGVDVSLEPCLRELVTFFRLIREQNHYLSTAFMTADQFNAGADYDRLHGLGMTMNQALIDDIQKNPKGWSKHTGMSVEQLMNWANYMHQFKLLYGASDASQTLAIGYTNYVDMPLIANWFDIPKTTLDLEVYNRMTKFAKAINYERQAIKNIAPIIPLRQGIGTAYKSLLTQAQVLYNKATSTMLHSLEYVQFLKQDTQNPIDQLAVLRAASKQWPLKDLTIFKADTGARKNPYASPIEVHRLIHDKAGITLHPVLKDTEFTYMETLEHIDDSTMFDNVAAMNAVIKDFEHSAIKPLETLANSLDVHKVVSANAYRQAINLKPFAELMNSYAMDLAHSETYQAKADYTRSLQNSTDKLAVDHQLMQILRLPPEHLRVLMIEQAPFITFQIDDQLMHQHFISTVQGILQNTKAYEELGIKIFSIKEPDTGHMRLYFALDLDTLRIDYVFDHFMHKWVASLNGMTLPEFSFTEADAAFENFSKLHIAKKVTIAQAKLNYLSGKRSCGTLGDLMPPETMLQIYTKLPAEVQECLGDFQTFIEHDYWDITHYNFSNLGAIASRKYYQPGYPNTIISLLKSSASKAAVAADTRLSMLEAFHNPAFSINNGILSTPEFRDNLIEALQRTPEIKLVALVEDKKYGYRTIEIDPGKPGALQLAQQLNAVLMPYHIYSKFSAALNQHDYTNKSLKLWNQALYAYKVGCLVDPGVFFRNAIDSPLKIMTKTMSFAKVIHKELEAAGLLKKFDSDYKAILNLSQWDLKKLVDNGIDPSIINLQTDAKNAEAQLVLYSMLKEHNLIIEDVLKMDTNKAFLKSNLDYYFAHMQPTLPRQMFDIIDTFIDNASAGMTKTMEEQFLDKALNSASDNVVWNTALKYSNKLMHPNTIIDQVNRLAQYLINLEDGASATKAFYEVSKTHFDYANKSPVERVIEYVLPFYTFKMRNLDFWIESVRKNPWLLTMFTDLMRPVWNFDDTTPEQLHFNKSLQYQILAGNIPLGNNLILKTNPSYMDAFNMILDPINSVKGSLITPLDNVVDNVLRSMPSSAGSTYLKNALSVFGTSVNTIGSDSGSVTSEDVLGVLAQLPVIGPTIQRYGITGPKNMGRSGSVLPGLLPGVFGALAVQDKYPHKLYPARQRYAKTGRGYYPYSKHPKHFTTKKPKSKKAYAKRTYAYRTYATKSYPTRVFAPKAYAHLNATPYTYYPGYYTNFYTKMYTKKGMARTALNMKLRQPQNLAAALNSQKYGF